MAAQQCGTHKFRAQCQLKVHSKTLSRTSSRSFPCEEPCLRTWAQPEGCVAAAACSLQQQLRHLQRRHAQHFGLHPLPVCRQGMPLSAANPTC